MKKTLCIILCALLCAASALVIGCAPTGQTDNRLKVVATNFPGYDFARAVCGDNADVSMLLPPGAESHSYEPTAKDIISIGQCDLFICVGGESESWLGSVLDSLGGKVEVLKMMDCVDAVTEEITEGMQTEHEDEHEHGEETGAEYDEHVWTSPVNASEITLAIGDRLASLTSSSSYRVAAAEYSRKLLELDADFRTFFSGIENPLMIFGDRFPLRYFTEEYGIEYYAAFPGCIAQTEPSAATVVFLIDKVKSSGVKTVFYIEFSNHLIADGIAEATGVKTALFHTCHNVSREQMQTQTYITLMRANLETLKASM